MRNDWFWVIWRFLWFFRLFKVHQILRTILLKKMICFFMLRFLQNLWYFILRFFVEYFFIFSVYFSISIFIHILFRSVNRFLWLFCLCKKIFYTEFISKLFKEIFDMTWKLFESYVKSLRKICYFLRENSGILYKLFILLKPF